MRGRRTSALCLAPTLTNEIVVVWQKFSSHLLVRYIAPALSQERIPCSAEVSSCLLVVEEETAKILPWPLAAAYGTESESKYDDKPASFHRAVPLSFSSFTDNCTGVQSIGEDILVTALCNHPIHIFPSLGPAVSVYPSTRSTPCGPV